MGHLLQIAQHQGAVRVFLEVRHANTPARAFYKQLNFCEVGQRRDYYSSFGNREDAIVMARTL